MTATATDTAAAASTTAAAESAANTGADQQTSNSAQDAGAQQVAGADQQASKTPDEIKAEQLAAIRGVLTLPQDSNIDPAITERTAATLSELGLTPENAPKVFGLLTSELASHGTRVVDALKAAFQPGGAEWQKQQEGFKVAALADPELGGGKPEQLEANTSLAKRVLATLFKDAPDKVTAIEQSALFNNPDALRLLVRVGTGMKEDQLVPPPSRSSAAPTDQDRLNRMYPTMKKS